MIITYSEVCSPPPLPPQPGLILWDHLSLGESDFRIYYLSLVKLYYFLLRVYLKFLSRCGITAYWITLSIFSLRYVSGRLHQSRVQSDLPPVSPLQLRPPKSSASTLLQRYLHCKSADLCPLNEYAL